MLKAYRELESKGLTKGSPGQGTFIQATLNQIALPELTTLHRSMLRWLSTADDAGLDEDGMAALFTSALRDFFERRSGSRNRGGASNDRDGVRRVNVIEANGLGKRFGDTWALRECTLSIPEGRVVALVGPNGAGKTTLLNLAVGLVHHRRAASRSSAGTRRIARRARRHRVRRTGRAAL